MRNPLRPRYEMRVHLKGGTIVTLLVHEYTVTKAPGRISKLDWVAVRATDRIPFMDLEAVEAITTRRVR